MNRTIRILALSAALGLWATALAAQSPVRRVSLEEALRLFAANNLDLRVARLEAAALGGIARQAGAFANPTLSVTHEPLSGGASDYSESYVNLSQTLELLGQRSARVQEAEWALQAASAGMRADSARLAFAVKRTYLEAALAEEQLAVTERVAEVFREAARSAAVREDLGDISRYDLQRILIERARYENMVADAQLRASSVRRSLALLIMPESDAVEVSPMELDDEFPPVPTLDHLVGGTSASLRPEVASAEATVEAAAAAVRLSRAERVPDLTTTGGIKRQSDGLTGFFLGLSIPVPLFNRSSGAVESAEARVSASQARLDLTRRQVDNDLRRAMESYESVRRRAELLEDDGLDPSVDLLQIAQVAYDLGEMGLLEILDAAEALRSSRNAAAQLKSDLWTAYYDLERAIGGLDADAQPTLDPETQR